MLESQLWTENKSFCLRPFANKLWQTVYMGLAKSPEKPMAPHSSALAWKILWTEEPGRLQSMGRQESDTTERLHFHFSLSCIGERNGNPLQCSCLENPRDGGAWWASVYGVTQSRTQLKRLSIVEMSCNTKEGHEIFLVKLVFGNFYVGLN